MTAKTEPVKAQPVKATPEAAKAPEPVKAEAQATKIAETKVAEAKVAGPAQGSDAATEAPATGGEAVEAGETAGGPKVRKKSLWELLNTPVQDLFKEGPLVVEEGEETEAAFFGLGREKPQLEGREKQSWLSHFRERLARTRIQFADSITRLAKGRTKVDEDMLEELEEILLQSDVGVKTTDDVLEFLRGEAKKRRFLPEEVLPALTGYLEQTLQSEPFRIEEGRLNIFLIVGVNGTGKTTTVGKVAAKLKIAGYRVMIAAGDTFRAAAIDQLVIWGQRVGVPVIQHHEGADAAAVVFDAIQSARAKKVDALLIDTAGRLHNKDYLMDELRKVHRIIEREKQDAHVECILVLDATTGQNGLRQAEVFQKAVALNSLILTKLDGTAKGGVIFGIKRELGIPIKLLGVGESLADLQEFDPKSFVQALFAQEEGAETAEKVAEAS
ncbi:MAG TPA: signal recognition particle-docking protein FtsY [Candidatus Obscuribacterales bacterium]